MAVGKGQVGGGVEGAPNFEIPGLGSPSYHGPGTPNPAGLLLYWGLFFYYQFKSQLNRHFTESSILTQCRERNVTRGPSSSSINAPVRGSIDRVGFILFRFIFAELPWEPEL